jgi:hypothetical protein
MQFFFFFIIISFMLEQQHRFMMARLIEFPFGGSEQAAAAAIDIHIACSSVISAAQAISESTE